MIKGDIVLVVFPFTDLSGNKLRPALVLAETLNDVTAVFITSQLTRTDQTDIPITPDAFNGIKKPSIIRIGKIATLDKVLVKGKLGRVNGTMLGLVNDKLINYLQLR